MLARWANAMLDTSDGLAESARLIAEASQVEVTVDAARLPLPPELRRYRSDAARLDAAFYGGDYELLASLPTERWTVARRSLARLGCPLTVVGAMRRGRGAWLQEGSRRRRMPAGGWRPFETAP